MKRTSHLLLLPAPSDLVRTKRCFGARGSPMTCEPPSVRTALLIRRSGGCTNCSPPCSNSIAGRKLDNAAALQAIRREVAVAKPLWDSYVLLDSRTPDNRCTALDEVLAGRAHHGLEHVFSLLALILPRAPVKVAFRALHTNDRQLRGAALEYLDNALPCEIHRRLWDLIGEIPSMTGARTTEQIVETLLESHRIIMERLSEDQPTLAAAAGTSAPPDGC